MNALGLPLQIQLEDKRIPLSQAYTTAGTGDVKDEVGEGSTLWRTDTDGDLAKWLNNGFTPRAGGTLAIMPFALQTNNSLSIELRPNTT